MIDELELEQLYMNSNKITHLSESFGNIKSLVDLDFNYNDIGEIYCSFENMNLLKNMSFHGNDLSKLPESLSNCTSLSELNISSNVNIKGIPEFVYNLTSLEILYLDNIG
eukprot:TRINITY_DN5778_c4_g1_i1.p1 TRINITY_DN5778_c4_g1~~TRINITY_DN5778_c4_g1_i1.p1  ORF type:complete len:110 (+),score=17.37 TRINITY_DN5778_c4_g1_i1:487-816(+)